jgi:phosphopantothenoylcysteine decarboxylase/phosphopantothenate--cysteine ligase
MRPRPSKRTKSNLPAFPMVAGKHILLGVTGGIAAYKTAYLVRELVKKGAEVQVVMTPAATEFITPLTLAVLSRREAIVDMFPRSPEETTEEWTRHIELGLWADVMLIAPASANTIAKIAYGLADNFLTTLVLALRCPLAIAPTMDVDMYTHTATQSNIATLRERGCTIIEPESGELASGLSGPGRLPEVDVLLARLEEILSFTGRDFERTRVLVTAGPTQEPIDAVRYVGNRSSGKMGFALAAAAAQRGAEVTLVSGPVQRTTPRNVRRIDVQTAAQMERAVLNEFPSCDVLIMAAAVADFAPRNPSQGKIKRDELPGETLTLELIRNADILKTAGEHKSHQLVIGFALEIDEGLANAQKKLAAKHLDLIVLNNPTEEGTGFGSDNNAVTIIAADGTMETFPMRPKIDIAHTILSRIASLRARAKRG